MPRTALTELVDRAVGGDADALRGQRDRAAHAILERCQAYPEQWKALRTIAASKFATVQADRGSGKTDGIASFSLARCISRDGYVVRIGAQTLESPTDNILDRDGHPFSTMGWLHRTGLIKHAQVSRVAGGAIKRIRFAWGSAIHVHDFETLRSLERKRGNTAHLWWFDEAQSLSMLSIVFATLVVPRLTDHDGQVVLSGTPGRDLGTMFHRYATGDEDDSGWVRCSYYSWDNVMHGATDEERWRRVLETSVVPARKRYGLRRSDIERMSELTREQRVAIARGREGDDLAPWVKTLDPTLLRERFGRWVHAAEEYLFAWHRAPEDFYFAAVGPHWRNSRADVVCLWETDAPAATTLADRIALLPAETEEPRPRRAQYYAVIGLDIGSQAPSAWVILVYAVGIPRAYAVWSETEAGLADGEILRRTEELIRELQRGGVSVTAVVADINGMRQGTGMEWNRSLRQRLPSTVPIVEAYKVDEDSQMMSLNLDITDGRLRVVCGDALDICARHLRWKPADPADPKPARPDLGREVTLPDETVVYPANHATDALRYAAMRVPVLMTTAKHQPRALSAHEAAMRDHEREAQRVQRAARR